MVVESTESKHLDVSMSFVFQPYSQGLGVRLQFWNGFSVLIRRPIWSTHGSEVGAQI